MHILQFLGYLSPKFELVQHNISRLERPIFYFKPLTKFNFLGLLVYGLITFVIFNNSNNSPTAARNDLISLYCSSTQLFLYMFGYKALRNMSYFVCWLVIGLFHLAEYMQLKADLSYDMVNGSAIIGLRNTVPVLIIYQILRFANLKIQHQELVAPSKGGSYDIYDERAVNFLDYLSFVVYITLLVVLNFYWK